MGKLLALSLLTTLAAAVLFQPVLMGKPRQTRRIVESRATSLRVVPLGAALACSAATRWQVSLTAG